MAFDVGKAIQSQQMAKPQKDYLWRIRLPELRTPPEASEFMNRASLDSLRGTGDANFNTENLSYRIINAQVPFFEISTDNQEHGNSFWYYATTNDIGSITLEIEEHEDGQTFEYFNYWKNLIANPNGTYNPPVYYKRDIHFLKIANVKMDLTLHKYKGYFVSQISDLSNSYDSNGIVRYSVTLTGDDMQYETLPDMRQALAEQGILNQEIPQASLLDRFTGLDGRQQRDIFDRVSNAIFSAF